MSTEQSKLAFNDGWQYAPAPESTDHITIDEEYGLFIGGNFVDPEEGRYFDTINPATEEVLSRVALATEGDVDRAVRAARKAKNGPWSKMKAADRGKYIFRIARILQERKEEARLLPGLDRTDEPVFNVPKLGKNHLRAWQDHRLVMIKPEDGSRVYEFHPWEKNIAPMPPYNYTDVPIYDYLEELAARGENLRDYHTIWYYY